MLFDVAAGDDSAWGRRTYEEIADVGRRDGSILVLPVGSVEQHGDHLPVATDTILVSEIAALGAERVADDVPILTLPPFWSGFSPHHLSFGGTVSLEFEHMLAAIEDVADTALENGFGALVLLNGHGGNISLIDSAVSTIGADRADAEVLGLTYFQLASAFIDDVRESDVGGMAHAGEFETSLMLYLHEDLVRVDRMEGTYLDEPYDLGTKDLVEGGPLAVYRGFEEYSATGAIGDPELASAEKGERIYELLGDELESVLRSIHRENA